MVNPGQIKTKIQGQAGTVVSGAKTWKFWRNGALSAMIGGGFGAVAASIGVVAAEIRGMDTGETLTPEGLFYIFLVGGLLKASQFLKDFKLPD